MTPFDWIYDLVGLLLAWLDFAVVLSGTAASVVADFWGGDEIGGIVDDAMDRFIDSLGLVELPENVQSTYTRVLDFILHGD